MKTQQQYQQHIEHVEAVFSQRRKSSRGIEGTVCPQCRYHNGGKFTVCPICKHELLHGCRHA